MICFWRTTLRGFISTGLFCTTFNRNKHVYSKLYQNFKSQPYSFDIVNSCKRKWLCSVIRGEGGGSDFGGSIEEITLQRERMIRKETIASVPLVCIEVDIHGNITSKQVQKTELGTLFALS